MAKYRKQVIPTDWDEELFEGKNKAYGGYRLRKNAGKRLLFGWLITLTLFLPTIFWIDANAVKFRPKVKEDIIPCCFCHFDYFEMEKVPFDWQHIDYQEPSPEDDIRINNLIEFHVPIPEDQYHWVYIPEGLTGDEQQKIADLFHVDALESNIEFNQISTSNYQAVEESSIACGFRGKAVVIVHLEYGQYESHQVISASDQASLDCLNEGLVGFGISDETNFNLAEENNFIVLKFNSKSEPSM